MGYSESVLSRWGYYLYWLIDTGQDSSSSSCASEFHSLTEGSLVSEEGREPMFNEV